MWLYTLYIDNPQRRALYFFGKMHLLDSFNVKENETFRSKVIYLLKCTNLIRQQRQVNYSKTTQSKTGENQMELDIKWGHNLQTPRTATECSAVLVRAMCLQLKFSHFPMLARRRRAASVVPSRPNPRK